MAITGLQFGSDPSGSVCREEKTEQLMDSKHEAERLDQELQKLKQEVRSRSVQSQNLRPARLHLSCVCGSEPVAVLRGPFGPSVPG